MALIPKIEFPELFLGLVAPIGTPLNEVLDEITNYFENQGYQVHNIHVTDLFDSLKLYLKPEIPLVPKPLNDRYASYIAYGNQVRKYVGDASILAALSIQRIVEERIKIKEPNKGRFSKNLYIINQLKRPEEVSLLRAVYGRLFFQLSVYSKRSSRVDYLAGKFSEDAADASSALFRSPAEKLVDDDENQSKDKYGQRVGKIFHDADFIMNRDIKKPSLIMQLNRFLELLFSSNTITPTKMEYGMFAAKSAALRTADLSRQVGAAIFSEKGEIISLGSNEVPKAAGGTYWPDEEFDDREFHRKIDSNDKRKGEILRDILKRLGQDWDGLDPEIRDEIQDSSFMDALEYGRIVHAEMSAISDAARLRGSLRESVMYTTTFPCHMCAKHIVSSGVKSVVYLEPYPKSLALRLHADSISIDGQSRGGYEAFPAVDFSHFYGVTPRRYRELFERGKRKDSFSRLQEYVDGKKIPNIDIKSPFYTQLEDAVLSSLLEAIKVFPPRYEN